MPTIDENRRHWGDESTWSRGGDEWSDRWGTPEAQWTASIRPRIAGVLPARRVVEIAPGHGRWTSFLLEDCDELIGVDLADSCVRICRERFAGVPAARFAPTDGRSLSAVPDGWADLVFSFDSLVHADRGALSGYLGELARVLAPDGVAFLHHSNLAECGRIAPPGAKGRAMAALRLATPSHGRDPDVGATWVRHTAFEAGLSVPAQELVTWDSTRLIDAFTTITRPGSRHDGPTEIRWNRAFDAEARHARRARPERRAA